MRPTRLSLVGAVVLLVLVTACARSTSVVSGPAYRSLGWQEHADSPLSPRAGSVVAPVGRELVVVGGYGGPPCPPNADCAYPQGAVRRDGAAYDLERGTWRAIAVAPRPVPEAAPAVVIGERLFVLADGDLLVWDRAGGAWSEVDVPGEDAYARLVADGDRVVVVSSTDEHGIRPDRVLDLGSGGWTTLPTDPLKPSFDRSIVATPQGLVLTAKALTTDGGPADPALVRAAVLPPGAESWQTLPESDQLGGWRWSWTGTRLVDPTLGGADGGEVNGFDRVIPYGGRLDPASGTWSPLPEAPDEGSGGWAVEAPGGSLVAADGWIYDDADASWTRLPHPVDAPATPGSAAWVGDVLYVVGGADWEGLDRSASDPPDDVWSRDLWSYRAP